MSELVRVDHLKKYFKTHAGTLHAVDDVTLGIEEGTTLGVVGESGCGKSTLGRTILRMHEPTSGDIWYDGEIINSKSKSELKLLRRDMQMIFQDPYESIDPRMSISTIISEPLVCHRICSSKKEMDQKIGELMETVGIAPRLATSLTAAAGSAWASPGPWLWIRSSLSATSRSPRWTSPSRRRC